MVGVRAGVRGPSHGARPATVAQSGGPVRDSGVRVAQQPARELSRDQLRVGSQDLPGQPQGPHDLAGQRITGVTVIGNQARQLTAVQASLDPRRIGEQSPQFAVAASLVEMTGQGAGQVRVGGRTGPSARVTVTVAVQQPGVRRGQPGRAEPALKHVVLQVVGCVPAIARGGKQGPASELGEQITHLGLVKLRPPQDPGGLAGKGTAPGEHRQLLVPLLVALGQIGNARLDGRQQIPVLVCRVQIGMYPGQVLLDQGRHISEGPAMGDHRPGHRHAKGQVPHPGAQLTGGGRQLRGRPAGPAAQQLQRLAVGQLVHRDLGGAERGGQFGPPGREHHHAAGRQADDSIQRATLPHVVYGDQHPLAPQHRRDLVTALRHRGEPRFALRQPQAAGQVTQQRYRVLLRIGFQPCHPIPERPAHAPIPACPRRQRRLPSTAHPRQRHRPSPRAKRRHRRLRQVRAINQPVRHPRRRAEETPDRPQFPTWFPACRHCQGDGRQADRPRARPAPTTARLGGSGCWQS